MFMKTALHQHVFSFHSFLFSCFSIAITAPEATIEWKPLVQTCRILSYAELPWPLPFVHISAFPGFPRLSQSLRPMDYPARN